MTKHMKKLVQGAVDFEDWQIIAICQLVKLQWR